MNKLIIPICLIALLFGCATTSERNQTLEQSGAINVDSDANNAMDVSYGGTNAVNAAGARTNLGVLPNTGAVTTDVEIDVSSGKVRLPNSSTLPSTCADSEIYIDNNATSGERLYICESGSWVLQSGGGGGGGVSDVDDLPGDIVDDNKIDDPLIQHVGEQCLTSEPLSPVDNRVYCADGSGWQVDVVNQGTAKWLVVYRLSDDIFVPLYDLTNGIRFTGGLRSDTPWIDLNDSTKKMQHDLSNIPTSTTITVTQPTASYTPVGLILTQEVENKTFDVEKNSLANQVKTVNIPVLGPTNGSKIDFKLYDALTTVVEMYCIVDPDDSGETLDIDIFECTSGFTSCGSKTNGNGVSCGNTLTTINITDLTWNDNAFYIDIGASAGGDVSRLLVTGTVKVSDQ